MSNSILEVVGVTRRFGGLAALKDVSFNVERGEILALIGPNGAGKTTMFNVIAGAFPPSSGAVRFQGRSIVGLSPDQRCHLGIARTFQIPKPFLPMTVDENVRIGLVFGGRRPDDVDAAATSIMSRLGLLRWRYELASTLPLGARKKLEIARALGTGPSLLLLDEVMGGLTPGEMAEVMQLLRSIRDDGITIVFVEHVMRAVRDLSDKVVVLSQGEIISQGSPEVVTKDPKVVSAYMGTSAHVGTDH